nr:replication protein RepA [Plastoroseomonas arctica]
MPLRSTRGAWQRDADAGYIRIEPGSSDDALPSGRVLRLSMMYICDAAFRANSPVVELGHDGTTLAAAFGIDPYTRDLDEQWQRLQAARILLSESGTAEISVFDARSRRRAGDISWRSGVRLSSKFLASLVDHAVPLNRDVAHELSATPTALDAYAWLRMSLHFAAVDQVLTTPWNDLMTRFGTSSQSVAEFRSSFEIALQRVFEVERSVDLAVDDAGVSVRRAELAETGIAASITSAAQQRAISPGAAAEERPKEVVAIAETTEVAAAAESAASAVLPRQHVPSRFDAQKDSSTAADFDGAAAAAADQITQDSISLASHLTGLAQVIWLRRGLGEERVLVGVTPTQRFEADRLTILAVEPMVIQVSGGLDEKDFERVSAWVMSNRDVIDDFWEGRIVSFKEVNRRVRRGPAPGWR